MTSESKEPLLKTLAEEEEENSNEELNDDNHNLILSDKSDKFKFKKEDSIKINMKNSSKEERNLLKNYVDNTHKRHVQMICILTAVFYAFCSFLILVINKIVLTTYR